MSDAVPDLDALRATSREAWEQAAPRWGANADGFQATTAVVSRALVDALQLRPGQRVLELAAGPGDTGFLAAREIAPGGTLICSDGADAMLAVARERAVAQGVTNVEFRALELEWIDLPTADVDAVLCRWGIMLVVDPDAAAREIRRVLRPGGRAALAVWDDPERNPWVTITSRAMEEVRDAPSPPPGGPGMFALAGDGRLRELLESAGLIEVTVTAVALEYVYDSVEDYLDEHVARSTSLRTAWNGLSAPQRDAFHDRVVELARPHTAADGGVTVTGSTLVASASA